MKYDDKIGLNVAEAAEYMGISKQLMAKLTKEYGFPCIKFRRRIVINKNKISEWFENNSGKYFFWCSSWFKILQYYIIIL